MKQSIVKKLSANDVGQTGTHQAGILIPKQKDILSFFPELNTEQKNPRVTLIVKDDLDGSQWKFNFIYYNNKLFGGTRNEYRLTAMTKFFRFANVKPDDELEFSKDENDSIHLNIIRSNAPLQGIGSGVLQLSGGWKVINF